MAGRPAIYGSAAGRQAAYRARKAGANIAVDVETFEQSIAVLRSVIDKTETTAEITAAMKINLHALVDAMSSREGYTFWKLERLRRDAWGRYWQSWPRILAIGPISPQTHAERSGRLDWAIRTKRRNKSDQKKGPEKQIEK